ncbi:ATP-dependent helicase [Chondromyces apiculatus]|uniref:DNA 3'-5' helicase n=1 Tax=Chondromyces apiculatus DSM 436 TaxID=1192034 RepID=A0A017TCI0_9BACT|nr:UvrD-helicase domain-containing protein [Chondromyces apiculatus]EYF06510.1 ATP-dependent DNA helicase Rep [Chondromyces apiculatus DSM 436]
MQLNPSQSAAVEHDLGPMLVLAGAGSGKTRVVTERIARLLQRGVSARSILAMTFTNKASAEMHERVGKLVGSKLARELTVCTFHRFGLDVLGAETKALGLRGSAFAIFDQSDCTGVIREILRELRSGRSYDVGAILARISNAKNAFQTSEAWEEAQRSGKGIDEYDEVAMLVYPRYQAALRSFQAFDFDDLICEVVNLWKRRPDVLERWRTRYRYVIVDEYQDTNHAQLELLRLLGTHRNVVVVGDDDQSIYAWRGADVRNILDFEEHFGGAKVVKLEHNYRSRAPVLDVANAVLARAGGRRHRKTLIATRMGGDKVQHVICADPDVEASFVATEAMRLLEREGARPRDIAVLYRSNLLSGPIEAALKERQIPIRMIGGTQFFERKEVKDLIAYLKVALNPEDEMSLRRILNYPARAIGDAAVAKLAAHATARDLILWTAVSRPHAVHELSSAAMEGCRQLVRIVEATRQRFERGEPSAQIARALLVDAGFKEDIVAGSTSNSAAARRWGNLEGLLNVFTRRDEQGKGDREQFANFLRLLALRQESEEEEATDRVTLSSMHGSKGLEFPYVFVIGLEEGIMPHQRALSERATDAAPSGGEGEVVGHSIDEERRLFYVAVTRAKDRLYLCRAKARGSRGKLVPRTPSRFLLDVPEELLAEREEEGPQAPEIDKTKAGAASVLAALSFNPFSANQPVIPRRRP